MNPLREFVELIQSDLERYFVTGFRRAQTSINKPKIIFETFLFKAGFHAVLLFRISHFFYRVRLPWIAWFIQRLNVTLCGAEIEYNTPIDKGLFIAHPVGIVVGRGTKIGKNFTIYQNVTVGARHIDPVRIFQFPEIEDDVTLFAGAVVVGGVRIGSQSTVGANAVVIRDVPPGSVAVGVPAKVFAKKPEPTFQ